MNLHGMRGRGKGGGKSNCITVIKIGQSFFYSTDNIYLIPQMQVCHYRHLIIRVSNFITGQKKK